MMENAVPRLKLLVGTGLIFLFPALWYAQSYVVAAGPSVCAFHSLTGCPCPFCGLTRALSCATHGEFRKAFAYHHFWWLSVMIIVLIAALLISDSLCDQQRFEKTVRYLSKYARIWYAIFFLSLIYLAVRHVIAQ